MRRRKQIWLIFILMFGHLSAFVQTRYHIVQPKENLYRIALNNKVKQEDIMRWNHMATKTVFIGNKIIVWKSEETENEEKNSTSDQFRNIKQPKNSLITHSQKTDINTDSLIEDSLQKSLITALNDSISKERSTFQHQTEISSNENQFLPNLKRHYKHASLLVKTLLIFVLYFLISILTLIVIIAIKRFKENKKLKTESTFRIQYQNLITSYLFNETIINKEKLKKEFKSKLLTEIFLSELLMLMRTLSGENKAQIRDLYFELGLDKYSLKSAKSKKWHIKAKGFSELAAFEVTSYSNEILKYINNSNPIVAAEAEIALVQLLPEKPFNFIKNIKKEITPWEQLIILDLLKKRGEEPDTLIDCLSCKNESVVQFAIKLIGYYKQTKHLQKIIEFLDDKNETTRGIAIEALGMSNSEISLKYLHDKYNQETYSNKLRIISALVFIQSDSNINFLEKCLFEPDFNLSLSAAHSLYFHGKEGILVLEKHQKNEQVSQIINHVLDNRI